MTQDHAGESGSEGVTVVTGTRPSKETEPPSHDWSRLLPILGAGIVVLLAIPTIGSRSLWLDEAFTVTSTNQLFESLWHRAGSMGLYYALMTPWADISFNPTWLRLPSLAFAAIGVALAVNLARRHFGNRVAVWTAIFLPLMWGTTRYAQEARSYSLTMMLATATWMVALEVRARYTSRMWLLWVVGSVALIYSHPLTALIVIAQIAFICQSSPNPRRQIVAVFPWLAILSVLLVPMVVSTMLVDPQPSWVPPLGRVVFDDVIAMVAGDHPLARIVVMMALIWATVRIGRTRLDETGRALLLWLWFPFACLAIISVGAPMLLGRYLTVSLPAAALACAVLVTGIRSPLARGATAAVIVLALLSGQLDVQRRQGDAWDQAVEFVASRSTGQRSGALFLAGAFRLPFELAAMQENPDLLERLEPINPSNPWGSALRYPSIAPRNETVQQMQLLDEIWVIEQRDFPGATTPPLPLDQDPDPLTDHGFCREDSVMLYREITVARFGPCSD